MKNIEDEYHFEPTKGKLGEPKVLILKNGEVGGEILGEISASLAVVGYAGLNGWAKPGEIYSWLRNIAMDIIETHELIEKNSYMIQIQDLNEYGKIISDYETLKQKMQDV